MPSIHLPRNWRIPEKDVTPEQVYLDRRRFLRAVGAAGMGLLAPWSLDKTSIGVADAADAASTELAKVFPAKRNTKFAVQDREMTREDIAARYNNFYEFTEEKTLVATLARNLKTRPWKVEVTGLVRNPRTFDIDDLLHEFAHEERIYRFRCVEAWAMVVPWAGFPFSELVRKVEPRAEARYVRMWTFLNPEWAPNQKNSDYPWPYFEGLTLAEAMNELTLLATGIYGHELPPQHGAPLRLVVPWKYGFKSIKSIVKMEFTDRQPSTFWNQLAPTEYDFYANVNPKVPHPRWSQASERLIGTRERAPTTLFNGYEASVAGLYKKP
ncbi:MAG: protein-methionine-sulfoxide reductase catalytic subunit MsrP [Planctomycetes bacterium]|nr:protein-methionine-sulfoxide reductase catalytic subunit MsrP [Planctomycetota bacterium]